MFRLPSGWSRPSKLDDVIVIGGVKIHRCGVAVTAPTGEEVVGAAADRVAPARDRAWYELAERVCILEAINGARSSRRLLTQDGRPAGLITHAAAFPKSRTPQRWVYARSNGIALHRDWQSACRRAYWELAERDRVLRAWRGEICPVRLRLTPSQACAQKTHEWMAYSFPAPNHSFSEGIHVVGAFAFPRSKRVPLAVGFAARPVEENALTAAIAEATQQLAFLWGEVPPQRTPRRAPSAGLHLDTYQVHARHDRVRAWLDGGHVRFLRASHDAAGPEGAPRPKNAKAVHFIDLTTPWLASDARVAKAVCESALPLAFGDGPSTRHLPPELRLHPIP